MSLLPDFIHTAALRRASLVQTGNGEPRKAHWLGDKRKQSTDREQDQKQGGDQGQPPRQPGSRGYRSLSSVTLGEVEDAYNHFRAQLVPSPAEGWMAKNYFCQLPLNRYSDGPPLIFGRIKTIYPSDGHAHNIEEMEMYFPHTDAAPDVLHIRAHDLSFERPVQTYCIGVKFSVSPEEMGDFSQSENIFLEKGFAPLYENGYLDLLDAQAQSQSELPFLHVIGSEWFAFIPDSVQPEIRAQLRELIRQGNIVFNYHPRRHALRYLSLNEELDFQYGFSEEYLIAPQNTEQTLRKVEGHFGQIFLHDIR